MQTPTALVVEDNAEFRASFCEVLRKKFPQVHVVEAESAEEALPKIEAFTPELIFIDVELPGKNGLDLAGEIRRQDMDITIIILTNYDQPEFRDAAARHRVDYFFSKAASSMEEIFAPVRAVFDIE